MKDKVGNETLKIMKTVDWYNSWLFSFISKLCKGKILEVGAGIGNFTEMLSEKGEVYAVDYNKVYVKKLQSSFGNIAKVGFGDIEKGEIEFKNIKFDTIVCMNVVEHIKDDKRAIKNMYNLLSEGGKLIIIVPAFAFAFGLLDVKLGHYRRYRQNEVYELFKDAGLKQIDTRYLNSLALFGWTLNSKLFRKKLIPKSQLYIFNIIARPLLVLEKIIKFPFGLSVLAVGVK